MSVRAVAYLTYARWLRFRLAGRPVPRHVAIVMDGNRRWARQRGLSSASQGHRHGAEHLEDVLGWCADVGITHVTVFAVSADNLRRRAPGEIEFLLRVGERLVADRLARPAGRWQVHLIGRLDLLPDSTAHALKLARDATRGRDLHLTLAVGYSGRQEVVDALRSLLTDRAAAGDTLAGVAGTLADGDLAGHLGTAGQPDPDLVIRTSGEQRLSDFLLWQTAGSELYFCDAYWPGFRHIDFLRALRSYAARRSAGR
ncbi:MAG TPA: polyprenyl diphosphate synthase [Mycobacteriales bacterium]|nr:polyprenyl diphosphate synthase [Mycobacteriales bacterium]